jgi:hypothetical protein
MEQKGSKNDKNKKKQMCDKVRLHGDSEPGEQQPHRKHHA